MYTPAYNAPAHFDAFQQPVGLIWTALVRNTPRSVHAGLREQPPNVRKRTKQKKTQPSYHVEFELGEGTCYFGTFSRTMHRAHYPAHTMSLQLICGFAAFYEDIRWFYDAEANKKQYHDDVYQLLQKAAKFTKAFQPPVLKATLNEVPLEQKKVSRCLTINELALACMCGKHAPGIKDVEARWMPLKSKMWYPEVSEGSRITFFVANLRVTVEVRCAHRSRTIESLLVQLGWQRFVPWVSSFEFALIEYYGLYKTKKAVPGLQRIKGLFDRARAWDQAKKPPGWWYAWEISIIASKSCGTISTVSVTHFCTICM